MDVLEGLRELVALDSDLRLERRLGRSIEEFMLPVCCTRRARDCHFWPVLATGVEIQMCSPSFAHLGTGSQPMTSAVPVHSIDGQASGSPARW